MHGRKTLAGTDPTLKVKIRVSSETHHAKIGTRWGLVPGKAVDMSLARTIRRNLQKSGEAQRAYHKKDRVETTEYGIKKMRPKTCWLDLRPRDKEGNLQGHCADQSAARKKAAEKGA